MRRIGILFIGLGIALGVPTSVHALELSAKCEALKLKLIGKFQACLMKTQSKAASAGLPPSVVAGLVGDCQSKFLAKWDRIVSKIIAKDENACHSWVDEVQIVFRATALADLTRRWQNPDRFVDNGDGTITDYKTGLMWEKKTGTLGPWWSYSFCNFNPDSGGTCADLHNVNNIYDWQDAMGEWLSRVNGRTDDADVQSGLAGYTDWRVPTIVELQTILIEPFPCGTNPCIDSIFGPTSPDPTWSSTTTAIDPFFAWAIDFYDGFMGHGHKEGIIAVRAVRGGP